MIEDFLRPLIAWPLILMAAWLAGEWSHRRWQLPRVCAYGAVGLLPRQSDHPHLYFCLPSSGRRAAGQGEQAEHDDADNRLSH